jgi:flagellar biosynthesis protein FlhF
MQVKTFTAKDAPAAMARVKAELGGDAVILSTRKCAEGGRSWCEITAALDSPLPQAAPGDDALAAPAPAGANGTASGTRSRPT